LGHFDQIRSLERLVNLAQLVLALELQQLGLSQERWYLIEHLRFVTWLNQIK
jgi:hypothetical protein